MSARMEHRFLPLFISIFLCLVVFSGLAFAYVRDTQVSIDPVMINYKIAEDNVVTEKLITLSGSVSSIPGIKALNWRNNRGGGGKAILRIGNFQEPHLNGKWFIGSVPLMLGKNVITVTAMDMKGVRNSEQIIVIRE